MSHKQELAELKNTCENTGNCSEYTALLAREDARIDTYTAEANVEILIWGALLLALGILTILTPRIRILMNFQKWVIPKLVISFPILLGAILGFVAGFVVSFSACFKQQCSTYEESAIYIFTPIAVLVAAPFSYLLFKKKTMMEAGLVKAKSTKWIVVGLMLIALSIVYSTSGYIENDESNAARKESLRRS